MNSSQKSLQTRMNNIAKGAGKTSFKASAHTDKIVTKTVSKGHVHKHKTDVAKKPIVNKSQARGISRK